MGIFVSYYDDSTVVQLDPRNGRRIATFSVRTPLGPAFGDDPTEPMGWASFAGKATYLEPGWPEPIGNCEFVVYIEDRNGPGTGVDRFWFEVHDKDRLIVLVMSMDRPAAEYAVDLWGGNVVAPH